MRVARFAVPVASVLSLLLLSLASLPSAADSWVETNEADFLRGAASNVTVAPSGDIFLGPDGGSLTGNGIAVDIGAPGSPDRVRAYNPSVLREDNGAYAMWYAGFDGVAHRILRATSLDGRAWTKEGVALDVGQAPWDFTSVSAPFVLKEGGSYRMWFHGASAAGAQIYYASSTDGSAWTVEGLALARGAAGEWDRGWVHYPFVARNGTDYWLYYAGWDGAATTRIGLAVASGPTGFVRHPENPILSPGAAGAWDDAGVFTPSVLPGTLWRMFYVGNDPGTNQLGLAYSPDGLSWTRWPGNPLLSPSPGPTWDDAGILSAFLVPDDAGGRL